MADLFDEARVNEQELLEAYQARLLSHPPTDAFNADHNRAASMLAARIAKKDIARVLAILDEQGWQITEKPK